MIDFRWAEAEHSLRRATELDPRAPRARFYYAIYLHRQGRWDDAFAQMARARELDPLSLPINALYGSFLGDLGRVDEAIAHLKATLELDSAFPITQAALGHIYMGTERHDHALRHYQRVAELVPVSMYAGFWATGTPALAAGTMHAACLSSCKRKSPGGSTFLRAPSAGFISG